MHAENRYAITYNDSSRMWTKKHGGKWERELEREKVVRERERWDKEGRELKSRGGRVEKNKAQLIWDFSRWREIFLDLRYLIIV